MNRINVFVGNYGSGKTEISMNIAIKLKNEGKDVLLFDMDIVNPYFRSSEHKIMLKEKGIDLIGPTFANTAVDLPTLPPEIYTVLSTKKHVVIDCGGDPAGATAMGFLAKDLEKIKEDMDVFFVMNTCRPLQSNIDAVLEMINSIEQTSKLKLTKLILNSNVANDTTYKNLEDGLIVAKQISKIKNLEIEFIVGKKDILDKFKINNPNLTYKLLDIEIFMRPEWLDM
jgi:hypothetical protein